VAPADEDMANYAVWNNRLRHEWLTKPQKSKYLSKSKRQRIGLEEALARKSGSSADEGGSEDAASES
jgi:hypothetical protein